VTERAVLAVGANLGEPLAALQSTVDALRAELRAVSPVYRTDPVGGVAQPDFLNAVLLLEAKRSPEQWLACAQSLERAAGRRRDVRWGPRTLDVDVIAVGGQRRDTPELTVPHPRAHERAFVLVPWLALDPDAVLPGHGPVRQLLERVDVSGVVRRDELVLR